MHPRLPDEAESVLKQKISAAANEKRDREREREGERGREKEGGRSGRSVGQSV